MDKLKKTDYIIEIAGDAGEGAQVTGHILAACAARMGNYLWTVDIIPSEIRPPAHTVGGASGCRIRLSDGVVTNSGNRTELIFAFNEQSLQARIAAGLLRTNVTVFIDDYWAQASPDYGPILNKLRADGASIVEVPLTGLSSEITDGSVRGKNMCALGMLTQVLSRDEDTMRGLIRETFASKGPEIVEQNLKLFSEGLQWAKDNAPMAVEVPGAKRKKSMVYMNGNQALALGAVQAGFEVCSMYPITPASSVSHTLAKMFHRFGGILHQAEDEIAAIGVAIGASYGGKYAFTVTSGPGLALKTEFQGLAVMTETPLVIIDVQRGGPSTGLPTKIEQSDLNAAIYGTPGDAPKVVLAPATIEECYHIMTLARKIAYDFRMVVIVLSDANLATGIQLFERPEVSADMFPAPPDLSAVPAGTKPYDWDEQTGLSRRLVPGTPGGAGTTSSLNHNADGNVRYDAESNMHGHSMRSKKLAVLQASLQQPVPHGDDSGDLLIVGWGSTRGAVEEAVDECRSEGISVSSLHLYFLNPLPPGLKQIFSRFRKVVTVELNYADQTISGVVTEENRRYGQLAWLLRARTLTDVDSFAKVYGRPLMPAEVADYIRSTILLKSGSR